MRVYSITVSGFDAVRYEAENAGKAKWAAFKDIREAGYITDFKDFLRRVYVLHMGPAA